MPDKIRDGGLAFPADSRESRQFAGMSLRDYFAAAALTGLLAKGTPEYAPGDDGRAPVYVQDTAYRIADAMLAARERKP